MLPAVNQALLGCSRHCLVDCSSPTGHASNSLELIFGPGFVQRVLTFSPSYGQPQSPGNKTNRSQAALTNSMPTREAIEAGRPRRPELHSSELRQSIPTTEFSQKNTRYRRCLFFSLELKVRTVLALHPGTRCLDKLSANSATSQPPQVFFSQ